MYTATCMSAERERLYRLAFDSRHIPLPTRPWLTPAHPDPRGDYIKLVARALKPLLANGQRYALFWE